MSDRRPPNFADPRNVIDPGRKDSLATWMAFYGMLEDTTDRYTTRSDWAKAPADEAFIHAAIRLRALSAASVPLRVYVRSGHDLTPADLTEDKDAKELQELLDFVNPDTMSSSDLKATLVSSLSIYGEAYLLKTRGRLGGRPKELHFLNPANVTPKVGDHWIDEYVYQPQGRQQSATYSPKDIIAFRVPGNFVDPTRGLSPINAVRMEIGTSRMATEHTNSQLRNQGVPAGVWVAPKDSEITTQDQSTIKRVLASLRGPKNAGKTAVLPGGLEWRSLGFSEKDAQYLMARKVSRMAIGAALGVPLALLGDDEHTGVYRSTRDAEQVFWRRLTEELNWMAQIIDSWLTSEYDKTGQRLTVRFDTSAVEALRPTIMEQSSLWQMMLSMGIVTTNEARAHFGVGAPVEWGNVPVRSGGLAPIGVDGMPVMPAAPAAPGAPAPEGPKPAEGKEPAVVDAMTPEDESDDPEVQPLTPTVSSWQGFGGLSQTGLPKGKKHGDHDQSAHGNRDGAGGEVEDKAEAPRSFNSESTQRVQREVLRAIGQRTEREAKPYDSVDDHLSGPLGKLRGLEREIHENILDDIQRMATLGKYDQVKEIALNGIARLQGKGSGKKEMADVYQNILDALPPVKSLKHADHDQSTHGNRDGGGYVRDEKKEEQAAWYLKRDVTDEDRKAAELSGQDIDQWALNKVFDESAAQLKKEREAEKQAKERERVALRETQPRIAFDKSTPVPGGVATIAVSPAQADALATTLWGQGEGSIAGYTEELERTTREAVEAAISNPRGGLVLPSYGAAQAIVNSLTSVAQARSDDRGSGAARRYINLAEKIVAAMRNDPFATVSGSHATSWVFDPFDQPSGEGWSLAQLDTPAKFLAIKHGDHDQSDHGNRDGAGGGSDSSSPTAGSRGGAMGYRATAAIESAGGRVRTMSFDSDNAAIEKFQEQVEEAFVAMLPDMDDPDNISEDHDPRIASGIEHMGQALMDQGTPGAKITIIQDKDGNIAGAGSSALLQHPDGYEAVHLTVFGTNGLVAGAGSAIISRLIGEAFENDQGFVITAAEPDAWEFYERIGLGAPQKNEGGGSATFLLTPEQVGDWIALYVAEEEGL